MAMFIDRLPNEILVKIFVLCEPARTSPAQPFVGWTRPEWRNACTWAPLMAVCRHWRAVALETPLLWQVIDIGTSTRWLELALVRSRGAVLELYFHSYQTCIKTLPMLMPQMHRVRKLLLPPMQVEDLTLLSSAHATAFPVLNELRVWIDEADERRPGDYVPLDLSPTRTPALRVLLLQCAVVPWTLDVMSKLRFLHLQFCSPVRPRPSFAQFLDVLEECQELETLELHHFISQFAPRSPGDPTRTIRLPKLRRLVLGDTPDSIAGILANMYVQETVSICLEGWPAIVGSELQQGFESLLPRKPTNIPVLRTITDALISLTYDEEQDIVCTNPQRGMTPLRLTLFTKEDFNWQWYHPHILIEFTILFKDVPLKALRVFLEPGNVQHHHIWVMLFTAFSSLREVDINPGGDPLPVFVALSSLARTGAALCPALERIEMDYLEWTEQHHGLVMAALKRRAQLGLRKLDYVGLGYREDGSERFLRALERDRATLGDISDYVTTFDCRPS